MENFFRDHPFLKVGAIVSLIWILFFIAVIFVAHDLEFSFLPHMALQSLSSFGSSFNILTSLFTGLAFAGVIISIRLQSSELKTAVSAFQGQKNALQNQEFDNKFFQMLHFFAEVKRNVKCSIGGKNYGGNDIFKPLLKVLVDSLENGPNEKESLETFETQFSDFNDEHEAVKYYFLNLYQILNYVKRETSNGTSNNVAIFYTNMLRAQLSKSELILLAYNSIGIKKIAGKNYQNLVEEFAFFEHLQLSDFLKDNANKQKLIFTILNVYDDKAFGTNKNFIEEKRLQFSEHYANS